MSRWSIRWPACCRRQADPSPALPRPAPLGLSPAALVGGGAPRQAGRDQPGASRRAVPRRVAGIPARRAGGAAPADGDRPHHHQPRQRACHLPRALPVHRGDEPLPLRLSRRRARANARARRAAGRTTRRALRPAARPHGPGIEVQPIAPTELARAPLGETSAAVAPRIAAARERAARPRRRAPRARRPAGTSCSRCSTPTRCAAGDGGRRGCACPRAARSARCASRAPSPTSRVPRIARAHVAEALAFRHRVPGRA